MPISKIWGESLERLEEQNHILATKIKHAEVKFAKDEIQLIYNGGASVHAESVKEHLSEIKNLLKESGLDVNITVHEKENKQKQNVRQEAIDHPLVRKALQLFEGRIYNIIPKKGGGNNV